jgi:hypothetical protein
VKQYYILTLDPNFLSVVKWIRENNVKFEAHLNRTRFWVKEGEEMAMFLLTWGNACTPVDENADLITGMKYGSS